MIRDARDTDDAANKITNTALCSARQIYEIMMFVKI